MSDTVTGCIYALMDPGSPGLIKIGKDHNWPYRFRQAQSHTPRGMIEVGRWLVSDDRKTLRHAERKSLALFRREKTTRAREWVRASVEEAVLHIGALLGLPQPATPISRLRPYDDWRDWVLPRHSQKRRRLWIGVEQRVDRRLKLVHSPHTDLFRRFCPAYSFHGIGWLEAWGWPVDAWSPLSNTLHPADRTLIDLWTEIVGEFGYGADDGRLGWLREGADVEVIRDRFRLAGLLIDGNIDGFSHSVTEQASPVSE